MGSASSKRFFQALVRDIIIHSDEGKLAIGIKCTVALVSTLRQAAFLCPSDPADLAVIALFTSWTCVFHSLRLGLLLVEISLIHGHIISRSSTFMQFWDTGGFCFIRSRSAVVSRRSPTNHLKSEQPVDQYRHGLPRPLPWRRSSTASTFTFRSTDYTTTDERNA